ncbi:MAG: ligand-binding sensor domain-containing protein, partial [Peptostreptococcaceae bacterium]
MLEERKIKTSIKFNLKVAIISVLIFLMGTTYIYAYDNNVQFRNITTNDGLSQASAEVIFQDSKGYIWIGTSDGLNRYDGYNFKVYKYKKNSDISIASDYIFSIDEDANGNIWAGTISGVSKISLGGNKVTNYYAVKDKGNLSNNNGADILITQDGNVLVGTEDGINIYDEKSDTFNRILSEENSLTSQEIYSLDQDENGDVWIGTDNGLNKIDVKNKQIKQFYSSEEKNTISENSIYKVYCDDNGYVWIGTENQGVNKIDINTNKITRYEPKENDNESLQGGFVPNILRDRSGIIWVCTDNGLCKYNEKTDTFTTYKKKLYDAYSLINDMTISIIQDRSGLIWVGTYAGISVFNPENEIELYQSELDNKKSLNDNVIHGLYEDDNGYIWAGTKSSGVNILKRNLESDSRYEVEYVLDKDSGLSDNSINYIVGDEDIVWIGTRNGLNKVDKKDKSIKKYELDYPLANSNIKSLMLDSKDYLWIGTANGINILNTKNDEIIDITYLLDKYGINDHYIQTIYEANDGRYLLGTFKEGYTLIINPKNKNITSYREGDIEGQTSVYSFSEDENYFWAGTSYGLNRIDKSTEEFKKYTEEDGLCNNNIYSIIIDDKNKIWVSTNDGISSLDSETEVFTNYNITDGLQSNEFNAGAYYKCKDGSIMFGGINGFNIFNPLEMEKENLDNKVVLEEFVVNSKSYNDINNLD